MNKAVCLCVYIYFLYYFLGSFSSDFRFVLLCHVDFCFVLFYFYYYPLEACFLSMRDRKSVDLDGRGDGEELEEGRKGKL